MLTWEWQGLPIWAAAQTAPVRTAEGVLSLYPHGLGGLSAWPWRSTSSAGSVRAGHNSPHEEAMSTDP